MPTTCRVGCVITTTFSVHERGRLLRTRVHSRLPGVREERRSPHRRHRQAIDGLRIPCSDDVLADSRNPHDRTDRERVACGARPILRRHDLHPSGDQGDRGREGRSRRQRAQERAAHDGHDRDPTSGRIPTRASRLPGPAPGCVDTSSGRLWHGWTTPTAIGTWCAPASRSKPTERADPRDRLQGASHAHPPRRLWPASCRPSCPLRRRRGQTCSMPSVFSDHMVLQRGPGGAHLGMRADARESMIQVTLAGQSTVPLPAASDVRMPMGRWMIRLPVR